MVPLRSVLPVMVAVSFGSQTWAVERLDVPMTVTSLSVSRQSPLKTSVVFVFGESPE